MNINSKNIIFVSILYYYNINILTHWVKIVSIYHFISIIIQVLNIIIQILDKSCSIWKKFDIIYNIYVNIIVVSIIIYN